jgi:hypothetical protein
MKTATVNSNISAGGFSRQNRHFRTEFATDNPDNAPSSVPDEELVSLEEFKSHFEKRLFERLGLKISL